jgi:hypothetical protein
MNKVCTVMSLHRNFLCNGCSMYTNTGFVVHLIEKQFLKNTPLSDHPPPNE